MTYPMHPVSSVMNRVSKSGRVFARSMLMMLGAWAIGGAGGKLPAAATEPSIPLAATEPSVSASTEPSTIQYANSAKSGTATVSGTSTLHNWTVSSPTINGTAVFSSDFNAATPPAIESINVVIPVNSLKSTEGSGMDSTMYDALKMKQDPNITFSITGANLTSAPSKGDAKYRYAVSGPLTLANWKKWVNLTLDVLPNADGTLTISTSTPLKMTDFGMKPPTAMLGMITAGDDVTVDVTWQLTKQPTLARTGP